MLSAPVCCCRCQVLTCGQVVAATGLTERQALARAMEESLKAARAAELAQRRANNKQNSSDSEVSTLNDVA